MTSLVLLTACRNDSQPTTKPVTFVDNGASTEQLCSDNDASALPVAEDADCDGVTTADDCDDNSPQLGASSHDKKLLKIHIHTQSLSDADRKYRRTNTTANKLAR